MSREQLIGEEIGLAEAVRGSADSGSVGSAPSGDHDWALLGESLAVRQLRSQIQRIAPHYRVALIRGEAGCGKQAVGRAIHALSPASGGRFVAIAASAMIHAPELSGAEQSNALESARGGTLYLKGVGNLSSREQGLFYGLLRGAERGRGGPSTGLRILAETDRNLHTLTAMGQFNKDLLAELTAVEIVVPPLRARVEDISVLAQFLLGRAASQSGVSAKLLAGSALLSLQRRRWRGNLRDLERGLREAAAAADRGVIEPCHLAMLDDEDSREAADDASARSDRLQEVVKRHVLGVLTQCGGNKLRTAETLGISRSTLYRMLENYSVSAGSADTLRKPPSARVAPTS